LAISNHLFQEKFMNADFARARQRVVLAGITMGLLLSAATPLLGGTTVDAAKKDKGRQAQSAGLVRAAEVQRFDNNTPVAITDNKTSTPSSITVSGLETPIADVEVFLNVLTHPQPADLDMLLVGPGGQMAVIFSDAGATGDANGSLILDDQASNLLPNVSNIRSGTFQPTNYDFGTAPEVFSSPPAPVVTPPSGSALSIFNGTQANGTWTLYIDDQDDDAVDTNGNLAGGWGLRITTKKGVPTAGDDNFQAQAGVPLTVPTNGVLSNDSDPEGEALTAIVAGQPRQGTLNLQPDGGFTYTANKKASGSDSFSYVAQDPDGLNSLANVDIQITKAKKKHKKGKH
jgi:subtilisin-like proprotein convertase family protein